MDASPRIQRAALLQQQGRHDMAENELRQVLAATPEHGFALALLALSLAELERLDEAENAAREAVGHEPDMAFTHYALARVFSDRNRLDEASAAIQEAVRLEPEDADYHGVRAAIEISRERWQEALVAAETGLQADSEHVTCGNLRAMALVKLGRKAEAGATIDGTLAKEPENSFSHANKGWTLLEQGRRQEALQHFKESLRLEPGNEWARQGLLEALKAGNPLYAIVLKYFLWMNKLSPGARWGILIGGYFGSRFLGGLGRANPELAPLTTPIVWLYISFALLTWLAVPVFNLLLFLHPLGRHALTQDQRRQAILVGACLSLAVVFILCAISPALRSFSLLGAKVLGILAIPISGIFSCSRGWPRVTMTIIASALAAFGLGALFIVAAFNPPVRSGLGQLTLTLVDLFFVGTFISLWVANFLSSRRPAR
jgi:tetratricopeptide (TPR) repeat protein